MVCFVDIINIVVNSATGVTVFGNNIFSSSKEDRNNKGDEQRRKQRKVSVRIRLTLAGCERIPFCDGLTKIHKPGCPFLPIVFSVNTYNYDLASYLVDILLPISANQFTIKASFSFAHLAKSYNHNKTRWCALFTLAPCLQSFHSTRQYNFVWINKLYVLPDPPKLSRSVLKVLLELATKKTEPFYFRWSVLRSNWWCSSGINFRPCYGKYLDVPLWGEMGS